MELISHHQQEEFGKGQKETPHVSPLPRIPLTYIHLSWVMHAPPGKATQKLIPITLKPETASQVAEQFSCVPLPYCSPHECPFPLKCLALSAHVSHWQFISECQTRAQFQALKVVPLPAKLLYRQRSVLLKLRLFQQSCMDVKVGS